MYVYAESGIWMMTFVTDILKIRTLQNFNYRLSHPSCHKYSTYIDLRSFKRHGLVKFRNMHTYVRTYVNTYICVCTYIHA